MRNEGYGFAVLLFDAMSSSGRYTFPFISPDLCLLPGIVGDLAPLVSFMRWCLVSWMLGDLE